MNMSCAKSFAFIIRLPGPRLIAVIKDSAYRTWDSGTFGDPSVLAFERTPDEKNVRSKFNLAFTPSVILNIPDSPNHTLHLPLSLSLSPLLHSPLFPPSRILKRSGKMNPLDINKTFP